MHPYFIISITRWRIALITKSQGFHQVGRLITASHMKHNSRKKCIGLLSSIISKCQSPKAMPFEVQLQA